MKMTPPFRHIPFLLLLSALAFSAERPLDFESEIQRLDSLDIHAYRLAIDTLHFKLFRINDPDLQKAYTERLFSFTQTRDEIAHIRSLVYPVIYPDSLRLRYLNEAFQIAERHGSKKELAWLEERRCRYHMEKGQYDAAMASILKLRDEYRPGEESDDNLNIENILGDIYFESGLYAQARQVYLGILKEYERKGVRDFWRPYVIMNNIGLIGIKTRNYSTAMKWFRECLNKADTHLTIPEKNNIKAFSWVKLMEAHIQSGQPIQARHDLENLEAIPVHQIYSDVQQELMFWKSKLLLLEGNAQGALHFANALMVLSTKRHSARYNSHIHLLLSQIYKALGHLGTSLQHLERYNTLHDSLCIQQHLTRSLLLLAEKDHQFTKNQLIGSRQEKRYLAIILCLTLLALLIVSLLFRRLYFSKLELVNQAIKTELRPKKTQTASPLLEASAKDGQSLEMDSLAQALQLLVDEKKIYLDPELTLQKTAEYLCTNRTYLSNAVNLTFDMNFPTYINRRRVQESIRLISEGFTSKQTLEALATQSGFASRTVFITAFKNYTGVPPSFFIKNYKTQYGEHFS